MKLDIGRILIAGTGSGSGKTTITAGILKSLKNRGLQTASFKCGPDYIDPMFHSRITGRQAGTLDPYFCNDNTLRCIMSAESAGCDLSVAEGVMGYYDGIGFTSEASTYNVARATGTPVILVVSCRGMGASSGALLRGFLDYVSGDSMIRGVIFNHLSDRLAPQAMKMAEAAGVRPAGYLPADRRLTLESRHLGLVKADEIRNFDEIISRLAAAVEKTVDLDALIELASEAEEMDFEMSEELVPQNCGRGVRIAVARDSAFSFIYRENMDMLMREGCEIVYFSPLDDPGVPEGVNGLILPGGYPELYAGRLSMNRSMRKSVADAVNDGMPVIAECGGFLYLHSLLEGSDGARYPMAGVIEGVCTDSGSPGRFGYAEMTAEKTGLLCEKGSVFRAHEFHYWDSTSRGSDFAAKKPDGSRSWQSGFHTDTMYAGFPHIHFGGSPEICRRFIRKCAGYRERNY